MTSEKWTTVVSGMATEGFFYVKTPNFSHEKDMFIVWHQKSNKKRFKKNIMMVDLHFFFNFYILLRVKLGLWCGWCV